MASQGMGAGSPAEAVPAKKTRDWLTVVLFAFALAYAALAGLRTVTEYDLGWQMATGRWIVQHHQIPSTDVFSYTAQGQPWIYPVGAGLLFYTLFLVGSYTLLSWSGVAACVAAADGACNAVLIKPCLPEHVRLELQRLLPPHFRAIA